MTTKRGAIALTIGGLLWTLTMVAYVNTHGPGTTDHQRLLFGLSHDNYMLFLSLAALLIGVGLASMRNYFRPQAGRLFAVAAMIACISFGVFAVGNLLVTAPVGIGEHPPWPSDSPTDLYGGIGQFLAPLVLGICLATMGITLWRARRFRAGATLLLLPIALIALAPWQPIHGYAGIIFGAAWAVVGLLYAAESGASTEPIRAATPG